MYGYIYRITNKVNGKTYIGSRRYSCDHYWREYMGSGVMIKQAIQKYGKENFIKSFLGNAETIEELLALENQFILIEKEKGHSEYNLTTRTIGGDRMMADPAKRAEVIQRRNETIRKMYETGELVAWNKGQTKENNLRMKQKSEDAIRKGTYKGRVLGPWDDERRKAASNRAMGNTNGYSMKEWDKRKSNHDRLADVPVGKTGETSRQLHDRLMNTDIAQLRKNFKRPEILDILQISNNLYQKFMRSHGYTNTPQVCFFCHPELPVS